MTGGENNTYVVLTAKWKMTWITCQLCTVIWPRLALSKKESLSNWKEGKVFSCQKSVIRADGGCCDQNMWETEAYIGPELNVNSGT